MLGPFYCQHQRFVSHLILKRDIKSFSVDTHLFRGIIIKIRNSLRWGTLDSVKLSEWHYVRKGMLLWPLLLLTADRWHLTCDRWQLTDNRQQVTCDRCHVICDRWQMACDMWPMICYGNRPAMHSRMFQKQKKKLMENCFKNVISDVWKKMFLCPQKSF